MEEDALGLHTVATQDHHGHVGVMGQGSIPASLVRFTHRWLAELGLASKRCLLVEDGQALPHPFTGSMRLCREDGTWLELDTVAKPLDPDDPYVQEVRAGKFDLIVISIAGWCLREGAEGPCPRCASASHTVLQHTVLHELVHVAFPEYSAHNEWTDNKVRELLERASLPSQDTPHLRDSQLVALRFPARLHRPARVPASRDGMRHDVSPPVVARPALPLYPRRVTCANPSFGIPISV